MTDSQWKPWISIVESGPQAIDLALSSAAEHEKLVTALALACAKWHPSRRPYQGMVINLEADYFYSGTYTCALCRLFCFSGCSECLLWQIGQWCLASGSVFWRWEVAWQRLSNRDVIDARKFLKTKDMADLGDTDYTETNRLANEMFSLLMTLYAEEYGREKGGGQ